MAWWILERDRDAVSSISGSGTFAGLELRYCAEVFANRRASGEGLDFSSLPNLQQQQIDRAEALMRPRYSALKMQGGETLIPDYSAMEKDLPVDCRWALVWSESRLKSKWEAAKRQFEGAKTELFACIHAGLVTVVGRPNGVADPRPIETYYWPYYGLYAWNGEICAAPHNLGDGALASRLKQNSPSTEPTIWLDLRVEAQEICDLWPVEAPTSGTASHPNLEAEHRMRDAHATIRRLIRRKWPSALLGLRWPKWRANLRTNHRFRLRAFAMRLCVKYLPERTCLSGGSVLIRFLQVLVPSVGLAFVPVPEKSESHPELSVRENSFGNSSIPPSCRRRSQS